MLLANLNGLMALLFLVAVAVQHNDPDPVVWMTIYGIAFACCVQSMRNKIQWQVPAVMAGICLLWAAWLAPECIGKTTWSEMTSSWSMHGANPAMEIGREVGGLLIEAGWMTVLAVMHRSRTPGPDGNAKKRTYENAA
jgi:hypothetical protein